MPGPIDLDARRSETPEPSEKRKTLTLFRLNGEDYRVPARPPVALALRFLDDLNRKGEDLAVAAMLPRLLGEDAWQALLQEDDLTMEEFEAIAKAAGNLLMGSVKEGSPGPLDDEH